MAITNELEDELRLANVKTPFMSKALYGTAWIAFEKTNMPLARVLLVSSIVSS